MYDMYIDIHAFYVISTVFLVLVRVFPCILYINEQWCNSNKCTVFIKYDVLTVLPTCFGLNRPSSGQHFTEIPGNYNMSYIKLKFCGVWLYVVLKSLCVCWGWKVKISNPCPRSVSVLRCGYELTFLYSYYETSWRCTPAYVGLFMNNEVALMHGTEHTKSYVVTDK